MSVDSTPIWTSWTQLVGAGAAVLSALVTVTVLLVVVVTWRSIRASFRTKVSRLEELVRDLQPAAEVVRDASEKATTTLKESEKILNEVRVTLALVAEHQDLIHKQRDDMVSTLREVKDEVKGTREVVKEAVKEVKETAKKDGDSGTNLAVVRVEEWVPGISPERRKDG